MGKERLTIEVDADWLARVRQLGIDPQAQIERMLKRSAMPHEDIAAAAARQAKLRAEVQPGLDAYDRLINEIGDWSADLRAF